MAEQRTKRSHQRVSWYLKRQLIMEYLDGTKTMRELSVQHNIPNQSIARWVKSYTNDQRKRKAHILSIDMTEEEQKNYDLLMQQNELLKQQLIRSDQELKSENALLKEELEFAQMQTKAMQIIIDLAKEEYGIDVTKNSGARQPASLKKTTRRQR
jgi:transposase-like protein